MTRSWLRWFGLSTVIVSQALAGTASAQLPSVPIREVLVDETPGQVSNFRGTTVTITGTITERPLPLSSTASVAHVQDSTGGLQLFARGPALLQTHLELGDVVEASGILDVYRGVTELHVSSIRKRSAGPPPAPQEVLAQDLRDGRFPGQLVRLQGTLIVGGGSNSAVSTFNLKSGPYDVPLVIPGRILMNSQSTARILKGGPAIVTGIAQRDGTKQPRILVRSAEDIVFQGTSLATTAIIIVTTLSVLSSGYFWVRRRTADRRVRESVGLVRTLRESQETLSRSEASLRSLVHGAVYGIYRSTVSGRILEANPALARMLGYGHPDELLSLDVARDLYVNETDRTRLLDAYRETGIVAPAEVVWKRRDGSHIIVRLLGRVVQASGVDGGAFEMMAENVTERLQLESQLRMAQKMEAVGRLAGGVAHDFNNLLTVMVGYAEISLARDEVDSVLRGDLEEIRRAGKRAAILIRQLLAFSRRQLVTPKLVQMDALIDGITPMLQRLITESVQLVTRNAPDLWSVRADPNQLEQVVVNLVVNARDAMPAGGAVTIETMNVDLRTPLMHRQMLVPAGSYVCLVVKDAGLGMDDTTLSHIFEPFFTTKDIGKGTGLGLATVYGIVQQSGGYIVVDSVLGEGAAFRVFFLRADATGEELYEPALTTTARGGDETVLLVEDEAGVRAVTIKLLERLGYTVIACAGAAEARSICDSHPSPIHLLLTDVVMPGTGGRELAKELLSRRPDMRVVYMSGHTDDEILRHGVAGGMAFIAKPFTADTLALKLRDILDLLPGR